VTDGGWFLVDLAEPSGEAESRADRIKHWLLVGREADDGFLRVADNGHRRGTAQRLVEQWESYRSEPAPTCCDCGVSAPLGSWVGEDVALAGSMAVTFHHWPRPCPAFLLAAGHRLGSRVGFAAAG
jgi:hypothetical protein